MDTVSKTSLRVSSPQKHPSRMLWWLLLFCGCCTRCCCTSGRFMAHVWGECGTGGKGRQISLQHWWLCCLSKAGSVHQPQVPVGALNKVGTGLLVPSKLPCDLLPQRLLAQENLCLWMKEDTLKCGFRFHCLSGTSVWAGKFGWRIQQSAAPLGWQNGAKQKLHPTYRAGNSQGWSHLSHSSDFFLGILSSPHYSQLNLGSPALSCSTHII